MIKIAFSPEAKRDLADIEDWLLREAGPWAAARVLERILDRLDLLIDMPLTGVARPELGARTRFVTASSYVIYYDAHEARIEVLRILHEARDRDAIMRGRSGGGTTPGED